MTTPQAMTAIQRLSTPAANQNGLGRDALAGSALDWLSWTVPIAKPTGRRAIAPEGQPGFGDLLTQLAPTEAPSASTQPEGFQTRAQQTTARPEHRTGHLTRPLSQDDTSSEAWLDALSWGTEQATVLTPGAERATPTPTPAQLPMLLTGQVSTTVSSADDASGSAPAEEELPPLRRLKATIGNDKHLCLAFDENDLQWLKQFLPPLVGMPGGMLLSQFSQTLESEGGSSALDTALAVEDFKALVQQAYRSGRAIRVQLSGQSALIIQIQGQRVSATLLSDDPNAQLGLKQNWAQLRQDLQARRLPVGDLTLAEDNPTEDAPHRRQHPEQSQSHAHSDDAASWPSPDATPSPSST